MKYFLIFMLAIKLIVRKTQPMKYVFNTFICSTMLLCLILTLVGCEKESSRPNPVNKQIPNFQPDTFKTSIINQVSQIQVEVVALNKKPFIRPVYTTVLTQTEYSNSFSNAPLPTPEQQVLRSIGNKILMCEGFIRKGDDYFSESEKILKNYVSGYYVPGTDSLYIIIPDTSTGLTNDGRVVLFHELIHAQQDQYFPLSSVDHYYSNIQGVTFSDMFHAAREAIEGEARYSEVIYYYKLNYNFNMYSPSDINNLFMGQVRYYDSIAILEHNAGTPLYLTLPFFWRYSYGPLFTNASIQLSQWQKTNSILRNPPIKTAEVLNPNRYLNPNRQQYIVDIKSFVDTLAQTETIHDYDDMGQTLMETLLREWDQAPEKYTLYANSLIEDKIVVAGNSSADSLQLYWYTLWTDSLAGRNFMQKYANIIWAKRNIELTDSGRYFFSNDTFPILIQQYQNAVIIMENCPPAKKAHYLTLLKSAPITNWPTGLAKRSNLQLPAYPCLEKGLDRRVIY